MGILSIQSHVATGRVGNAIVAFALQRLGHEVWPVHTVLFSNHPGLGGFRGKVRDPADLTDIIDGLEAQGVFSRCDAILGGYLGAAENGLVMLDAVERVRGSRPDARFYLDPVMGDDGKGVYVSEAVVDFYQGAYARADVLAPNAFELGVLTGRAISTPSDAVEAARSLLGERLRTVLVTSVPSAEGGEIGTLAVRRDMAVSVTTPRLGIDPKGAGDLFMALAAANRADGDDPVSALERAVAVVWSLARDAENRGGGDLPIIEHQEFLLTPDRMFPAKPV